MPVSGTEYLDLDQVERDFYSTRQDYTHTQQEVVTEERLPSQFPRRIFSIKSLRGELLGETLTETACPGEAR